MRKRNKPEVVKVGKYYRLTAIIDGRVEYMYTNSLKVVDIYRMAFKPPTRALFILFAEVADALPDYCGARWAYAKTEALNTLYRNLCSN